MSEPYPVFSDREILALRPAKEAVDPSRPYAFLVEPERSASGRVEDVATVFLTNRECPYRCLMCDLWKYTTDRTVPEGAIPAQIVFALENLPAAKHVKLYNAGSFFDRKAIPEADHAAIASLLDGFETVIVENHPNLCGDACLRFRDRLDGRLEVALGLETCHPGVLKSLNKRMTLDDFERAVTFLRGEDIDVRAFVLLRPPFMTEEEGVDWAIRSMSYAFDTGVQCCSVIPTRTGNGIMENLQQEGHFSPPSLRSVETVHEEGIGMNRGRVFMDVWDLERFFDCSTCGPARKERLQAMNLSQEVLPEVTCECR